VVVHLLTTSCPGQKVERPFENMAMGFFDARRPKSHPEQQPVRLEPNLGALPFAAFVVDLDGMVTAWNRLADKVFGVEADAAIGRKLADLLVVEPMTTLVEHVRRVLSTRVPTTLPEMPRAHRGQTVRLSASALIDDAARVVGCLVVAEDLGISNALRRAGQEPEGASDLFVALLAHELRNPLAPILSAAAIIRRVTDRKVAAAARVIERQVGHLTRLVDDLLDVSRIQQGRIELRRQRVDLAAATAEVLDSMDHHIKAAGLRVTVALPSEPIFVDADPTRLVQILGNLLDNALKYTGPQGVVTIAGSVEEDMAVLRVKDTGIGIDPRMLPRVFDLFVQAESSLDRSRGGLGLGLTLVRSLVELHGGAVTAYSEGLSHGSAFVVRLPLARTAQDVPPAPAAPATPRSLRKILIVEDDRDTREMLRTALELEGYVVTTAMDGGTGIREAQLGVPDALLIDLGLPGVDGFDTARQVRSILGPGVLLVALTGYSDAESSRRALAAGFDLHVVKPIDPDELMGLIAASRPGQAP